MLRQKSIIYINFSQYDNTGRILDYLLENFEYVFHFSYDHLRLKNGRKSNYLRIYNKKKLVDEKKLISIRTRSLLLFPSLPLVAILMFLQTLFYSWQLKNKYGKISIYFTVNSFTALIGIIIKKIGLCNKTIFWMWDYFPIDYPDWRMKFARWVYWQFDRPAMFLSDKLIFTNKKLLYLHRKSGILKGLKAKIVPIGTTFVRNINKKNNKPVIGFLGMLKEHQGLDLLFDNLDILIKEIPSIKIEVVGSGPEEERFKKKAKKFGKYVSFLGFVENQNYIQQIIKNWSLGLATYVPIKSNESYWGDPSKIKTYIGAGVPVLTTDVSYMSEEIKKKKAGIVIDYNTKEFIQAILTIIKKRKTYSNNAFKLARNYDFKRLYSNLFNV